MHYPDLWQPGTRLKQQFFIMVITMNYCNELFLDATDTSAITTNYFLDATSTSAIATKVKY
jgi:hypothetical protein